MATRSNANRETSVPILITSAIGPAHAGLRMACRQTWIAALGPEFRPFFVIGAPSQEEAWRFEGDILRVRCSDGYDHLPEKVRLALCAVVERFDFPWLFKCDDDTCINPWRFNDYPFGEWDQVGNFAWGEDGWASGAGYSLSGRAVRHVVYEMTCGITGPEDKYIGKLIREMSGARRFHEKSILPFSREKWEPCLLGHWIKSEEAMQTFHEKSVAHGGQQSSNGGAKYEDVEIAEAERTAARRTVPRLNGQAKTVTGGNGRIFVQIASYRDEDLVNTLRDLAAKAADPERLRFGLCWQRAPEESLEEFCEDARHRVVDVPWQKSQGLGWARRITQYLYDGEEFTLQLDAHERFVEGWDARLIEMMSEVESEKPILTTFPAGFTPGEPLKAPDRLNKIVPSHFREDGGLRIRGARFELSADELSCPIPSAFLAGGFFFTAGQHCREVIYDPHIYFSDETAMALRSFTHGYDLYHPHEHLAWHYYERADRFNHWDDHSDNAREKGHAIDTLWWERERRSHWRVQQLFGQVNHRLPMGDHGLGKVRGLADYERFAGLNFKERRIHPRTLQGMPPPAVMEEGDAEWSQGLRAVVSR